MKHKKEIYEKMKRRDFGESMCDETKLKVLNFVERQLRLYNVSESFSKSDLLDLGNWFDGSPEFVEEVVNDWLNAR